MKIDFISFIGAWIVGPLLLLTFAGVLNLLLAFIGIWCWNQFCEALHLGRLSYWQMWGLLMFCVILADLFHSKSNVS